MVFSQSTGEKTEVLGILFPSLTPNGLCLLYLHLTKVWDCSGLKQRDMQGCTRMTREAHGSSHIGKSRAHCMPLLEFGRRRRVGREWDWKASSDGGCVGHCPEWTLHLPKVTQPTWVGNGARGTCLPAPCSLVLGVCSLFKGTQSWPPPRCRAAQ